MAKSKTIRIKYSLYRKLIRMKNRLEMLEGKEYHMSDVIDKLYKISEKMFNLIQELDNMFE